MKKKFFIFLIITIALCTTIFFFYFNNIQLVNPTINNFYNTIKVSLKQKGYSAGLIVISTKRTKWHNDIQVKLSGAATESKHLNGDAIDFIVLDINNDDKINNKDVDIVFEILDKEIIKDQGGIGTYKNETLFIDKQMIHIDCRGYKARWAR